jgi:hypothetical protein
MIIFWQFVALVALGIVIIIKFSLDYNLVVGLALVISITNIIWYIKCHKDNSKYVLYVVFLLLNSRNFM